MNWINGLHAMGVVIMCVSGIGMMLTLGYLVSADIEDKPINWERVCPSIAVLVVSLLAGAFMAGATA